MADYIGRESGNSNSATRKVAIANSVTVYDGDFVGYNGSGKLTNASIATLPLLGYVLGGDADKIARSQRTANSGSQATGNSAGTVKVLVNVEPDARYLIKATGTLAATNEGKYFNLEGNAGAQLITNTASADAGQFELIKANPGIRGTDGTYGIFRLVNKPVDATA